MSLASRLAAGYAGPGAAIDPALIGIFFEIIKSFLGRCQRPDDAMNIAKRRPIMARMMFRPHVESELRAMKAEGTLTVQVDPARATKAIVEAAPGTTNDELQEIMG